MFPFCARFLLLLLLFFFFADVVNFNAKLVYTQQETARSDAICYSGICVTVHIPCYAPPPLLHPLEQDGSGIGAAILTDAKRKTSNKRKVFICLSLHGIMLSIAVAEK